MDESERIKTPVEILTLTRDIFKATHWITGNYAGTTWVEPKVEEKEMEVGAVATVTVGEYKAVGCSIGGMRYATLAPMDNALDEAWMVAHFAELGEGQIANKVIDPQALSNYTEAVVALATAAVPERVWEYEEDQEHCEHVDDEYQRLSVYEDFVVTWNDAFDYEGFSTEEEQEEERLNIVKTSILPTFDRAIQALKEKEAANGNG